MEEEQKICVIVCNSYDTCIEVQTFDTMSEVCAFIESYMKSGVTFTLRFEII